MSDPAKPASPAPARKPWVTPKRERLEADTAQLLTGVTNDGPGDES